MPALDFAELHTDCVPMHTLLKVQNIPRSPEDREEAFNTQKSGCVREEETPTLSSTWVNWTMRNSILFYSIVIIIIGIIASILQSTDHVVRNYITEHMMYVASFNQDLNLHHSSHFLDKIRLHMWSI